MSTLSHLLFMLERAGRWFDLRFGWFFTNGMKQRKDGPFRA
jgi:hypothetical protein